MSAKKSSVQRASTRSNLKVRRRQGRRRLWALGALFIIAIVALLMYGFNQPASRITHIEMKGGETLLPGEDPVTLAKSELAGKYFGIIPRDSTFFIPEHAMRAAIISAHPEIAAITFRHSGLNGLVIKAATHTAVGRWCGLAPTPGVVPYCYLFDPLGFVYAAAPDPESGTTTDAKPTSAVGAETLNSFTLYAPLAGNAQEPLRATIAHADLLPDTFAFARQVASFGSAVEAVVIKDDEANLVLSSGTRITYVLGHEQETFTALYSATYFRNDMNLSNGSLEYVDLRFPGKVYLKKRENN